LADAQSTLTTEERHYWGPVYEGRPRGATFTGWTPSVVQGVCLFW